MAGCLAGCGKGDGGNAVQAGAEKRTAGGARGVDGHLETPGEGRTGGPPGANAPPGRPRAPPPGGGGMYIGLSSHNSCTASTNGTPST